MGDPDDKRTPGMRQRDSAITMVRYVGLGMIGFAALIGLLGLGLLLTGADSAPELLAMAGVALVCGAGSYAIARSAGASIAPGKLTPDATNELVARFAYRNIVFVVFVTFWVIAIAIFLATARR